MQNKTVTKIVIDKLKLDILFRLGVDNTIIIQRLKGEIVETGDTVVDELLNTFIDTKTFDNWGGNHNPTGKNQYTKNKKSGQLDHQDDLGQDIGQLADKDIDKDNIYINNKFNYISTTRTSKFTPPTLQDVLDYAKEQSSMIGVGGFSCPQKIATEFWTHYDSQGWVKSNDAKTPITNWKSLLRSWTLNPNKFSRVGVAAPADYDLPL